MASIELREGMALEGEILRRLVAEAVQLDERLGDPTRVARAT